MAEQKEAIHEPTRISINGRVFISGLVWKQLSSPRTYLAEAKAMGKKMVDMEMVAIRRGRVIQAGFAPKVSDTKNRKALRSIYSLAACVARHLGEDGIGIFELPGEKYAFVAIHKGGILPGRDFVGDKERVTSMYKQTYGSLVQRGGAAGVKVIAPKEFGAEDNTPLDELVVPADLLKDHLLQPLSFGMTAQEIQRVVIFGGSAVALFIVLMLLLKHHQRIAMLEKSEALRAAINAANQRDEDAARAALVRGWQIYPDASQFVTVCRNAYHFAPPSLGGWTFQEAHCALAPGGQRAGDHLKITYVRVTGTTAQEFSDAAKALGATPTFDFSQPQATGSIVMRLNMRNPTALVQETKLPAIPAVMDQILDRTDRLPDGYVKVEAKPKPFEVDKKAKHPVTPDWQTYTLTIDTQLTPWTLLAGLGLDGVRFTDISATVGKGSTKPVWKSTGEIYGH